jgi:tripartite-type tricarboxylate transporter receptor subunit TctC
MSLVARLCIALSAFAGVVVPAAAQDYPTRPVRIVVPFGAGGPADIYARYLGQQLQETLKQTFVIENRPGAGAVIGTGEVAKSPPDGYTLLMMSNTHTTNETLLPNKPFQLMRDFVPVAPVNSSDPSRWNCRSPGPAPRNRAFGRPFCRSCGVIAPTRLAGGKTQRSSEHLPMPQ